MKDRTILFIVVPLVMILGLMSVVGVVSTSPAAALSVEYQKDVLCESMHKEFCFVVQGCTDMFKDTETCEMSFRDKTNRCIENTAEDIKACTDFLKTITCDTEVATDKDPCSKIN
jgi:hypothetical protein